MQTRPSLRSRRLRARAPARQPSVPRFSKISKIPSAPPRPRRLAARPRASLARARTPPCTPPRPRTASRRRYTSRRPARSADPRAGARRVVHALAFIFPPRIGGASIDAKNSPTARRRSRDRRVRGRDRLYFPPSHRRGVDRREKFTHGASTIARSRVDARRSGASRAKNGYRIVARRRAGGSSRRDARAVRRGRSRVVRGSDAGRSRVGRSGAGRRGRRRGVDVIFVCGYFASARARRERASVAALGVSPSRARGGGASRPTRACRAPRGEGASPRWRSRG